MPKKRKNFFSMYKSRVGIEYSMTMNFFVHVRITFKYPRFFFKGHWTKIDKNRDHKTPSQNPCFGGGLTPFPVIFLVMS